jgi:hypothetical protein
MNPINPCFKPGISGTILHPEERAHHSKDCDSCVIAAKFINVRQYNIHRPEMWIFYEFGKIY